MTSFGFYLWTDTSLQRENTEGMQSKLRTSHPIYAFMCLSLSAHGISLKNRPPSYISTQISSFSKILPTLLPLIIRAQAKGRDGLAYLTWLNRWENRGKKNSPESPGQPQHSALFPCMLWTLGVPRSAVCHVPLERRVNLGPQTMGKDPNSCKAAIRTSHPRCAHFYDYSKCTSPSLS